jgi:putative transcriptional regulator
MSRDDKKLLERDAHRNIAEELLQAVRDVKSGKIGRKITIQLTPVAEARAKVGLTQAEFAKLLGVSLRTLQEWEQGRRQPSGAAKSLIAIAMKRPEVLRELSAA